MNLNYLEMKSIMRLFLFMIIGLSPLTLTLNYKFLENFLDEAYTDQEGIQKEINERYPLLKENEKDSVATHLTHIMTMYRIRIDTMKSLCELRSEFEKKVDREVNSQIQLLQQSRSSQLIKIENKDIILDDHYFRDVQKRNKNQDSNNSCNTVNNEYAAGLEKKIADIDKQINISMDEINLILQPYPHKGRKRIRSSRPSVTSNVWSIFKIKEYLEKIATTPGKRILIVLAVLTVIGLLVWAIVAFFIWIFTHLVTCLIIALVVGGGTMLWNN